MATRNAYHTHMMQQLDMFVTAPVDAQTEAFRQAEMERTLPTQLTLEQRAEVRHSQYKLVEVWAERGTLVRHVSGKVLRVDGPTISYGDGVLVHATELRADAPNGVRHVFPFSTIAGECA